MGSLSQIEKGLFLKLFNRNGYVLDFSTNSFDVFTMESVGVALCDKYQMSKGKSLIAYIGEAAEKDAQKLLVDLFKYYEANYEKEYCKDLTSDSASVYFGIQYDAEYSRIYNKCKEICDKISSDTEFFASSTEQLKTHFSSEYLSSQIDIMCVCQLETA